MSGFEENRPSRVIVPETKGFSRRPPPRSIRKTKQTHFRIASDGVRRARQGSCAQPSRPARGDRPARSRTKVHDVIGGAESSRSTTNKHYHIATAMFSIDDFTRTPSARISRRKNYHNTLPPALSAVFGHSAAATAKPGATSAFDGCHGFDVLEVDGNRIERVDVTFPRNGPTRRGGCELPCTRRN